jgi:DNA replication protein DnaC
MESDRQEGISEYQDECEKHGPFTGRLFSVLGREIRGGCQSCGEDRRKADEDHAEKHAVMLERMRMAEKLGGAEIPKRFTGKTFAGYEASADRQQKALAACTEYAHNFHSHYADGRCLMLMGKPGCGKTHLAAAIACHVVTETKFSAVYRSMPGLIQDIRATYDGNTDYSEGDVIHTLTRCGLLVLDEIGATKSSEFELTLLFTVINGRYERKLPTVIVSNLSPKELHTAIGDRCVDRLREGGGIVVGFDWESMRGSL